MNMIEKLNKEAFVGFWPRVLTALLDTAILAGPIYLMNRWSLSLVNSLQSELPLIIPWLLGIAYFVLLIPRFGGTPGRLILRTRIINEKGNYPSLSQSLIRYSFFLINIIFALIVDISEYDFTVMSTYASSWVNQAAFLNSLMSWVIFLDGLFIIFTIRSRAIHDNLAGTYVVYKSELEYTQTVLED